MSSQLVQIIFVISVCFAHGYSFTYRNEKEDSIDNIIEAGVIPVIKSHYQQSFHNRIVDRNHGTKRRKVIKRRRKFDEENNLFDNTTVSTLQTQRSYPLRIKKKNILQNLNRTMLLKNGLRSRDSRFFSLFTVIRFDNSMCMTNQNDNGTCYTQADCERKGGKPRGSCASGYGVCCYFEYMCSQSTSQNGTYFKNPPTPQPICNLMINRMNDDICQIKLELDVFEIAGPNSKGECADEFFLVTGGSSVPPICGLNNKQHLIYSVTPDSGPSQLSVILSVSTTMHSNARLWNIRIYQYECTSPVLAPVGCLQYYTSASGVVQSFNYRDDVKSISKDTNFVHHLANLDYSACIRMASGYCGIRWSQYPGDNVSFTMTGDASAITSTTTLDPKNVQYGDACKYDYIRIPGGSEDGGSPANTKDRYCGRALGFCRTTPTSSTCSATLGAVITYSKPFQLGVVTDADEGGTATQSNAPEDKSNRGFRLVFNQTPCMS